MIDIFGPVRRVGKTCRDWVAVALPDSDELVIAQGVMGRRLKVEREKWSLACGSVSLQEHGVGRLLHKRHAGYQPLPLEGHPNVRLQHFLMEWVDSGGGTRTEGFSWYINSARDLDPLPIVTALAALDRDLQAAGHPGLSWMVDEREAVSVTTPLQSGTLLRWTILLRAGARNEGYAYRALGQLLLLAVRKGLPPGTLSMGDENGHAPTVAKLLTWPVWRHAPPGWVEVLRTVMTDEDSRSPVHENASRLDLTLVQAGSVWFY